MRSNQEPNRELNQEPNRKLNRNAIIDGTAYKVKDGQLCAAQQADRLTD